MAPVTVQAQSTYEFCNFWQYTWNDDPGNQDFLSHPGATFGNGPANHTWHNIWRDGQLLSSGYMDDSGCVETPAVAGDYIVRLYPAVSKDSTTFWIWSNDGESWEVFDATGTLPGLSSGTQTFTVWYGSNTGVGDMTAVAANANNRPEMGLVSGEHYKAYVDKNCPGTGNFSGCYSSDNGALYLGSHNGQRRIWTKHVVGHELGHMVSSHLAGGPQNGYYEADGCTDGYVWPDTCNQPQECQCNPHVVSSNGVHCLQSREYMNDAAQEGWAHFYATALFNDSTSPGSFTYYKEFDTYGGVIEPPMLNYVSRNISCALA